MSSSTAGISTAVMDPYAELPPSLRKKLDRDLTPPPKQSAGKVAHPTDVTGLVPLVARGSVPSKLAQRPLTLSNPPKESDLTIKQKEKAKEERRKQKIANKRRRSGRLVKSDLGNVPRDTLATSRPLLKGKISYDMLEPLHQLWLGYISELLNMELRRLAGPSTLIPTQPEASTSTSTSQQSGSNTPEASMPASATASSSRGFSLPQMQAWQGKLVKADFHGCKVEVTRAKHPSLVGLSGIIAQETEGTFRLVTPRNLVKVIPKSNVTFAFSLPLPADQDGKLKNLRFELLGSNFVFRGADRASKKFKAKGAKGLEY